MRNFVVRIFVNALALSAAAWLVPGISLSGGFADVLLVALVFGLVNAILKPLVLLLSLPFLLLTLGLFAFVVNAAMLLLTARLTEHLAVSGFGAALLGSLVISVVSAVLGGALKDERRLG
ncbi:MAG: phage holin family protein [Deltaproteobacteria bacterium]|nr:phage holin family protein [Deltaproteobacteria bacterium]